MNAEAVYPEHEKLAAVREQFDALMEFFDEWAGQRSLALCQLVDSGKRRGFGAEVIMEYQSVFNVRHHVYAFLDVSEVALETERRQMLDALRGATK